ncbi:MAG TPA: hypothetical protein VEZ70_10190 [Allosphingosinicella sp.]|nr:hypothetical protein [Allosphingosinicella sp.]
MLESHWARTAAAALLVLSATGCDLAPEEPTGPPMIGKLPAELCAQAKKNLDDAGKTGGFEYDGRGGATIREDAWIVMGAQGQGDLTQTLAVDAACKAGTVPREQQVFVRSEEGRTLSSRIVEIAPATDMFFED